MNIFLKISLKTIIVLCCILIINFVAIKMVTYYFRESDEDVMFLLMIANFIFSTVLLSQIKEFKIRSLIVILLFVLHFIYLYIGIYKTNLTNSLINYLIPIPIVIVMYSIVFLLSLYKNYSLKKNRHN